MPSGFFKGNSLYLRMMVRGLIIGIIIVAVIVYSIIALNRQKKEAEARIRSRSSNAKKKNLPEKPEGQDPKEDDPEGE